jgi:hypothetical protein
LAVRAADCRRYAAYIAMKSTLLLVSILLSAVSSAAQTHFYLDEPFKHPANIPNNLMPLLREEIKKACPGETVNHETDVSSWFSASKINVNAHRPAFILTSSKHCLTGADNDWFWIFLKTSRGYRLVLKGGTISLDVLRTRTHGLRDIETNIAAGPTNYRNIYKFNGSVYKARRCMESTPIEARPKPVPCRT